MMSDERKIDMTGKDAPLTAMPDAGHLSVTDSERRYLYAISAIRKKQGYVQSMHIAEYLNCSRPSVSVAVKKMKEKGLITIGTDGTIQLTPETEMLIAAETANAASENSKVMPSLLSADEISGSCAKYLTAIYQLQQSCPPVHAVDIADHLNISKPSVSKMLKNMAEKGLVAIDENFSITLTDKALQMIHVDKEKDLLTALQEETAIDADAAKCLLAVRELLLKQDFLYAREVAAYLGVPRECVYAWLTRLKKKDLVTFDRANHTFLTEKSVNLLDGDGTGLMPGVSCQPPMPISPACSAPKKEQVCGSAIPEVSLTEAVKEEAITTGADGQALQPDAKIDTVPSIVRNERENASKEEQPMIQPDVVNKSNGPGSGHISTAAAEVDNGIGVPAPSNVALDIGRVESARTEEDVFGKFLDTGRVSKPHAKYLAAIYCLSGENTPVYLLTLAEHLGRAKANVESVLGKMAEKGLVKIDNHSFVMLTEDSLCMLTEEKVLTPSKPGLALDAADNEASASPSQNKCSDAEETAVQPFETVQLPEKADASLVGTEHMRAYSGDQPFVFVSYAHKDSDMTNAIIVKMQQSGYRVWYDEGIEAGSVWDDNIAEHVLNCTYFIAFMSSNYLNSDNCKDELNFAREEGKHMLLIYLEDVKLPAGMRMRLNRIQALMKWSLTDEQFYRKLNLAQDISLVRDQN